MRPGLSYWQRLDRGHWFSIMMAILGVIGLVMTMYFSFRYYHAYKYGVKKESQTLAKRPLPSKVAYQLLFLSEDVPRKHVYVTSSQGEAVFWLDPIVHLAKSYNLNKQQILDMQSFVEVNRKDIEKSWLKYKRK